MPKLGTIDDSFVDIADADAETTAGKPVGLKSLTAAEVCALETTGPRYLIHRLAASGSITEVIGKLKRGGKTTFLLDGCKRCIEGRPFLGHPTVQTSIVYLTEQSIASFKQQLFDAGLDESSDLHVVFWHDTIGTEWAAIINKARNLCRHTKARILIVDTIGPFAKLAGDGENASSAVQEAVEPLKVAASLDGLAVIVVQHERKAAGDIADASRGNTAFSGAMDTLLLIRKVSSDVRSPVRRIDGISRLEGPFEMTIELTSDGFVLREDNGVVISEQQTPRFVPTIGAEYTQAQLRKSFPTLATTRRYIEQMLQDGKFKIVKAGTWRCAAL